jgi:hypothetical protein
VSSASAHVCGRPGLAPGFAARPFHAVRVRISGELSAVGAPIQASNGLAMPTGPRELRALPHLFRYTVSVAAKHALVKFCFR